MTIVLYSRAQEISESLQHRRCIWKFVPLCRLYTIDIAFHIRKVVPSSVAKILQTAVTIVMQTALAS